MRCRSCDTELPPDAVFCPRCGARQQAGAGLETIDRMIEEYRRRLDDRPDDHYARFNLALAYKHKGLDDLALAELERLRGEASGFADLEYELAVLYLRRGDEERARRAAESALLLDPDHDGARGVLDRIGRGRE